MEDYCPEDFNSKRVVRLRELRKENKMTIQAFADYLGVKKSSLYCWESGELKSMKIATIVSIADKCLVSPLWLIGFDVPKYKREGMSKQRLEAEDLLDRCSDFRIEKVSLFIRQFILEK